MLSLDRIVCRSQESRITSKPQISDVLILQLYIKKTNVPNKLFTLNFDKHQESYSLKPRKLNTVGRRTAVTLLYHQKSHNLKKKEKERSYFLLSLTSVLRQQNYCYQQI